MSEYDHLLDQARKSAEVFRAKAGEFVPKMYEALRKEGVDPWDAKDRIEKDLAGIWEKDTIRRFIPETAKNHGRSANATRVNRVRAANGNKSHTEQVIVLKDKEEIDNGDGLGSNEPESATAQWQKLKQDQEQKDRENDDYIHYLKEQLATKDAKIAEQAQQIKELSTVLQKIQSAAGVEGSTILELGDKALPLKYWLRLIPKFNLKLEVDATKARAEMYA